MSAIDGEGNVASGKRRTPLLRNVRGEGRDSPHAMRNSTAALDEGFTVAREGRGSPASGRPTPTSIVASPTTPIMNRGNPSRWKTRSAPMFIFAEAFA